jgi:protein SCO1/2
MRKRLAFAFLALMSAGSLAWAQSSPPAAPAASEAEPIGGSFMLVDQNGRAVSDEDFRGSFLLIAFGYTNCPDVCPTTLMTMASALNAMGPDAKAIRPIFISVDPARDTPARLKEYVESFGDNFVGLTGPEAYVASVARKFRISIAKTPSPSGGYSVDHTAGLFLVGPDGAFIKRFGYDMPARDLAASLSELVKRTTD